MLHLVSDSDCDLPRDVIERYGIRIFPMSIEFGDEEFWDDGQSIDAQAFYSRLAGSCPPRTGPPDPGLMRRIYLELAQDGGQILSIHVSGQLSQTVSRARSIAEELKGKADIAVIDTLGGSLAQGLLVLRAAQMAAGGATRGQIISILENLIPQSNTIFTVQDLNHLARGGRLSKAAALIGNMVALKPLIGFTADGSLTVIDRVHGWNRAVEALYQWVETHATHPDEYMMGVVHSRLPEEAASLADRLKRAFRPRDLVLAEFGPSIGTHVGPGALGIAFYSERGRNQD